MYIIIVTPGDKYIIYYLDELDYSQVILSTVILRWNVDKPRCLSILVSPSPKSFDIIFVVCDIFIEIVLGISVVDKMTPKLSFTDHQTSCS